MDDIRQDSGLLLRETAAFFIERLASDLKSEIDIRAEGHGHFFLAQWALYSWALLRDVARIPLHDPKGIGQARFRERIQFIREVARPVIMFFRTRYPFSPRQLELLDNALLHLEKGEKLINDGPIPALDEWYATMEEFHQLTSACREAADALSEFVNDLSKLKEGS